MEEGPGSNGTANIGQPPTTITTAPPSTLHKIFIGPNGLRAGWRLCIYFGLIAAISQLIHVLRGSPPRRRITLEQPLPTIWREWSAFAIGAFAAWIMSRIEKQPWGNYGMPWRNAFRSRFWFGALFGFISLSCVMACLHFAHCYYIDGLALHGTELWKYAGLWLVAFIGVGFFEEFTGRGYMQYTLASGMGFWGAALITSSLFLAGHIGNPGETVLGWIDVFLFGMLACFIWWRTGDLWLAVGFHAFWDWGLSFFYSVPDSGVPALGHLFNIRVQGPAWLSGGSAGPEGSAINLAFDLVYFVIVALAFPRRQFVGMSDRRQMAQAVPPAPTAPLIDSSALNG